MRQKRVVITGLGVIASNGVGKDAFWEAVFKGVSGIKPVSLFDVAQLKAKTAGEVRDFNAQEFLGMKGLRVLDRSTKLVTSATKLALDDAHLEITQENASAAGVVIGTTFGSINSICSYDREAIKEGPQYVNPALFPNTVINSPASQISIKFNIKGFNATIATGFCASLDAVNYAADFLRFGRAKIALAGGVEELCPENFLGFLKTGFLAGLGDDDVELSCPFDKRRNGVVLGEGSAVLVLEELESARSRNALIYAEVAGFGTAFDAYRVNRYAHQGWGLRKSMRSAIEQVGVACDAIDYVSAAANSTQAADVIETEAIRAVFGASARKLPVTSIKSMLGEVCSASGALQVIAAAGAIKRQMIHPTVNYAVNDPACDLDYVANEARDSRIDHVLINAFGPNGGNSSLVISRFKG